MSALAHCPTPRARSADRGSNMLASTRPKATGSASTFSMVALMVKYLGCNALGEERNQSPAHRQVFGPDLPEPDRSLERGGVRRDGASAHN
jgi:hypothetical protein